jgi:membrane protease YdiL (CAAX protease family)
MAKTSESYTLGEGGAPAPLWHTLALVGLILAVAVTGTLLAPAASAEVAVRVERASGSARMVTQYLPLLLVNSGLLLYVSRLFQAHSVLPELLGRRWQSAARAGADLALALGLALLIELLETLWAYHLGVRRNAAAAALLPHTASERFAWLFVAVTVGFCEEVVYRGYLQRQLAAFSGSRSGGLVLQALLFGIAHADQGGPAALRLAAYGLLFGALASFRHSLLPGIACHIALDLAAGFLR